MFGMRRREFITLLGGAASWPLAARAQQPAMPVIGFLHRETLTPGREVFIAAMKRGLAEVGYVEGRNIAFEYRWAEGQTDRLSILATDLVRRNVAVIVTTNTQGVLAAKSATQTIPIAFLVGTDPVESGLVESLNRPGGNATGVSLIDVEVTAKRIELLHQLIPTATSIALFVNPKNPITTRAETREARLAAQALGLRLLVLEASSSHDVVVAFTALVQQQASAILVSSEIFFLTIQDQLIDLAIRYKIPISIPYPESVRKGALIGYGANMNDAFRELGVFTGRFLKGERPADLPVQRSVKIDLLINLKTAKALGLDVPPTLLAQADEVIE
jgi:putative tryptophan/tyrosine transport system substrate-binding protein